MARHRRLKNRGQKHCCRRHRISPLCRHAIRASHHHICPRLLAWPRAPKIPSRTAAEPTKQIGGEPIPVACEQSIGSACGAGVLYRSSAVKLAFTRPAVEDARAAEERSLGLRGTGASPVGRSVHHDDKAGGATDAASSAPSRRAGDASGCCVYKSPDGSRCRQYCIVQHPRPRNASTTSLVIPS